MNLDVSEVLTFPEALADADNESKRHILLGNGFSIACRPHLFTYGALLDEAKFEGASFDIKAIFKAFGTSDFERIIELLQSAARLADLYGEVALRDRWKLDVEVVRDALARVLAARHPSLPTEIAPHEYHAAREFLSPFERIYTVNYDMLLYWTAMQDVQPDIARDDGFSNPDDVNADYVAWQPFVAFDSQRVFYLHGGLHLYDKGPELAKITWSRTGIPLIDQIRDSLEDGRYPLVVTEGTSTQKVTRILHSAYLNHAIRSFSKIGGALFVFGHSLAANDDHLMRQIADGKIARLYVSLYGDANNDVNAEIVRRAKGLAARRPARRPLIVRFYDAESAHVWS